MELIEQASLVQFGTSDLSELDFEIDRGKGNPLRLGSLAGGIILMRERLLGKDNKQEMRLRVVTQDWRGYSLIYDICSGFSGVFLVRVSISSGHKTGIEIMNVAELADTIVEHAIHRARIYGALDQRRLTPY